jgi:hypothetical protein
MTSENPNVLLGKAQWAGTLRDLRALDEDDLIARHDAIIASDSARPVVGIEYYLNELARRQVERQTDAMLMLTKLIAAFTAVSTVAVIWSVVSG